MNSEDNARPYFEKYMRNLTMNVDRLGSGQYTDNRVDNMWMDYMCGWTHCALFTTNAEQDKLIKRLEEIREQR